MLEIDILLTSSIKLNVHHIYNCSTTKFDSNWAFSLAWGILTIGVGRSFPSIGSSFKSKPKWIFLPHAKSTNSIMLYSTSIFYFLFIFLVNCTYSSIGNSSLPRFNEEMRFANSIAPSFILDHGGVTPPYVCNHVR